MIIFIKFIIKYRVRKSWFPGLILELGVTSKMSPSPFRFQIFLDVKGRYWSRDEPTVCFLEVALMTILHSTKTAVNKLSAI